MGRQAKSSAKTRSAGPGRSAMGEYIPPPGGRPLSSQTHPLPSPAHYSPSTELTLPHSPSYSLGRRPYPLKSAPTPSASKYDSSKDAVWMKGAATMKKKGVTWPYNTWKDAHMTNGPGAGHYLRSYGDTGSGMARAMSARHREGVHAGHPNLLVRPVDTYGFRTPGPNLWVDSERGPKHFIAINLKQKEADTIGPGPAEYTLPSLIPSTPLIGEKLFTDTDPQNPAPNEYDIPGIIGTGVAKTFRLKAKEKAGTQSPAPNKYTLRSARTPVSYSMTYRPFSTPTEKRPGPMEYAPSEADLYHNPEYSCKRRCLPTFPDILDYPEHTTMVTPGAGAYEYDREFKDNSNPAYSIKLPLPQRPNANPAPNQYHVNHEQRLRTSPRYSMSQKLPSPGDRRGDMAAGPGPATYAIMPQSAPSVSLTPRRTTKQGFSAPAPNIYEVERGQTNKGRFTGPAASMKGRSTPLRYSGFPSSHMVRLASLSG